MRPIDLARSLAVLTLAVAFLSGCGSEPSKPANTSALTPEMRGEPIAAAPTPAPSPTNSPAPVAPAPASAPTAPAAPATPAVSTAAAAPTSESLSGEPALVGFDKLSAFAYEVPDSSVTTNETLMAKTRAQIPESIRALDSKQISLKGFMLPLKVESGLVTELLLMRDQSMCCFGAVPKINEWVSIKMAGAGVKPVMDQPITISGRFKVGEMLENGYLVGIYQMDGERMTTALDF